jgi:hypothetical protein
MPWFLCDKYQVNKTAPKPLTWIVTLAITFVTLTTKTFT